MTSYLLNGYKNCRILALNLCTLLCHYFFHFCIIILFDDNSLFFLKINIHNIYIKCCIILSLYIDTFHNILFSADFVEVNFPCFFQINEVLITTRYDHYLIRSLFNLSFIALFQEKVATLCNNLWFTVFEPTKDFYDLMISIYNYCKSHLKCFHISTIFNN